MRIIAGKLKGATLYMPRNKNTRPIVAIKTAKGYIDSISEIFLRNI